MVLMSVFVGVHPHFGKVIGRVFWLFFYLQLLRRVLLLVLCLDVEEPLEREIDTPANFPFRLYSFPDKISPIVSFKNPRLFVISRPSDLSCTTGHASVP